MTQTEKRFCLRCGTEFTAKIMPSYEKAGRGKYCSRQCAGKHGAKISNFEKEPIIADLLSGMFAAEVAFKHGCSPTLIRKIARDAGYDFSFRKSLKGEANGMHGRTHTPEAVAKITEANRRQFSNVNNRERHALLTCKQIQEGKTGKAYNKLETLIADQFTADGIEFVQQYRLGRFLYDFYLPVSNTLLEVHGTFWHADPRVYGNKPLTPIQLRNTENDKRKAARAIRDGYEFRVMWEMDIRP